MLNIAQEILQGKINVSLFENQTLLLKMTARTHFLKGRKIS